MSFAEGDVVVLRQRFRGRIWSANAALVVADSPQLIALWLPRGSETRSARGSDLFGDWTVEARPLKNEILRLTRPGDTHSFLRFRHDDGTLRGWYVNIEQPLRRTAIGFDFDDLLLDLWHEPRHGWRRLDEDELDEALARGVLSHADAATALETAERVVAAGRVPEEWERWEPDGRWPVPTLPAGWGAP